jgi:hypothetical protein
MQRAVTHKVLGRGRLGLVPRSTPRARVLIGQPAGADVGRSATFFTVCVLSLAAAICGSGDVCATTILEQNPVVLSAEDRGWLTHVACDSVVAKDASAWTGQDASKVFADVVCAPHRSEEGHPVARYASCTKSEGAWTCEKSIERTDFSLPNGRLVSLEIIDTTVGAVDRVLTDLAARKQRKWMSALARLSGLWVVWADRRAGRTIEYSFAPEWGTRVFTLSRTCENSETCSMRLVRHR